MEEVKEKKIWYKRWYVIAFLVLGFIIVISGMGGSSDNNNVAQQSNPTNTQTVAETAQPTTTQVVPKKSGNATQTQPKINPTPVPTPQTPSETVSQKNAVRAAKSYLNYSAFSHDGLVAQLEYEKFSHADAVYGADNSGANWNEQAARAAKQYMQYSAFSRGSLITQLEYEKFTPAQAEYGANAVGL